jgi:hypothetical protein
MSLVGFTLLGTIEVPSITGSATAVPLLVKPNTEFTAAMLAALDAGGGDLRFGTEDGTTQYPCEIVDGLNTVWMTPTGLSVASAATVGVWGDNTGASQPAAGAAFGSEAVWVDSILTAHLNEAANNTAGGYTNSTGGTNGTGNSMSLANPSAPYGDDFSGFGGEPDFIDFPLGVGASELTISFWANPDSLTKDQRALSIYKSPIGSTSEEYFATWMDTGGTGKGWAALIRDAGSGVASVDSNATAGVFQLVSIYVSTTTVSTYKNGVLGSTLGTVVGNDLNLSTNITVGRLWERTGTASYFNGGLGGVNVVTGDARDQISIEYSNQSTAGSWWIAADAGGGIVIAPTSIPSGESFGTPTITTGIVLILPVAIPTQESVGSPTILKELFISPVTIPSEESVGDPVIELILQQIFPNGIPTEEFVGRPIVLGGDSIVIPVLSRQTWNAVAKYLRDLVFKGHDNDVIVAWLRSEGFEDGAYNDLWYDYLLQKGFIDGSLTDKYAAWRQDIAGDDPWILSSGSWNDNKIWRDNENWKDS